MRITNPTDKDIKIVYRGKELSLEAGESSDKFSADEVAQLQRIYGFLAVASDTEREPIIENEPEELKKEEKPKNVAPPTIKEEKKKESVISKIKKEIKSKK